MQAVKKIPTKRAARSRTPTPGEWIISRLNRVLAWANGEDAPVRVTTIMVPVTDVRAVRRRLKLSQTHFAVEFGFEPATLRTWEQGRTFPDGLARVLLAVIAKRPDVVEDALRQPALWLNWPTPCSLILARLSG